MIQRSSTLPRLLALLVTLAIPMPQEALAAWQENGVPVAPGVTGSQDSPILCTDGSNGAYIAWRQASSTEGDVHLQRLTASGDVAPGWSQSGLALSTRPQMQYASNIAPDGFGGVFVVWATLESMTALQFRLIRILANGTIAPGWPAEGLLLPAGTNAGAMDGVLSDGEGGVYIVWYSTDFRVWMLRYTGSGQAAPGWSAAPRPIIQESSFQGLARIIASPGGGFLASWLDSRGAGAGPGLGGTRFALKILPTGDSDPAWPPGGVQVNSLETAQENMFMISDGAGGAYVGWDDNRNGVFPPVPLDYDIYGQHVLGNGTIDPRWPSDGLPIVIAESAQYFFQMVEDGAGGVIFVWDDYRFGAQIYAVRIRPDGSIAPGWTMNGAPVAPHPAGQTIPTAVADGIGGGYAFWDQNSSVIGQHLDANGAPATGWSSSGRVIAGDASNLDPIGTTDGMGGAIVAYSRSNRIYAQRVLPDGPVPTRIAFLDSELEPGLVRLRWSASDAPSARAIVYRRQGDEPWIERGAAISVGESVLEFEDRDLAAGRYGYRLGVVENGAESFTEEVLVDVPSAYSLSLAGFQPNPASAERWVGFTLATEGPATITLHDVRGRAVVSKDVSSLGPGRHRIRFGADLDIAPGVYWIQLLQYGEMRRARGVILGS